MKKFLTAALAAIMVLTFDACDSSDGDVTTEKAKTTTAPEVTTTEPIVTTETPVTTENPVTTEAPVTTETPVTTNKPDTDTPSTGDSDAQALLIAANKASTEYKSYIMKSLTNIGYYISGQVISGSIESELTLKTVEGGVEAAGTEKSVYEDVETVSDYYYKGGIYYTSYEDTKYGYELSLEDFYDMTLSDLELTDLGDKFAKYEIVNGDNGERTVVATGFSEEGKKYIESIFGEDFEGTDVDFTDFSLSVTVDANGNPTAFEIKVGVSATAEGMTVKATIDMKSEYQKINAVDSIDFPSFDDYEIIDIEE